MKKERFLTLAAVAAMAGSVASAQTTLFNTLGPGDTHWGGGFTDAQHRAYTFDLNTAGDFYLTSITAPLTLFNPAHVNMVTLSVYGDAAGEPGAALESIVTSLPIDMAGATSQATTFNFSGTTVLEEGETYWFGVEPAPGTFVRWYWNVNGFVLGPLATRPDDVSSWSVIDDGILGGLRVEGVEVPAPGAATILAIDGLCGASRRRRR